jgi:3-hydroxybutyryl-CoA dehydrogenase
MSMAEPIHAAATVAVIGCGAMGAGIAQVAAMAGHPVLLFDARPHAADAALVRLRQTFATLACKGRMTAADADAAGARLQAVDALPGVAGAALIVEAIVEDLAAKRALFAALEATVDDRCILATNTSSLSVTAIGRGLARPGRLVGMHFFNPAPLMALVEIVSGLATEPAVADTAHATALAWGKCPVHAASTPGFIVNRVARPFYAEAMRVAGEGGAAPATLDAILRESAGFRMGPFELMDLIGHDVNFAVTSSVFAGHFHDPRFTPALMQQELVNAGFLGRKTGRGFYRYDPDAPAITPATEAPRAGARRALLHGADPLLAPIAARAAHAGVDVARLPDDEDGGACIETGGARIMLTDGRTATRRAHESGRPNTVLVDLAGDFGGASRVALARAARCSSTAYDAAVALFQAAGYAVSPLGDVPGMIAMRTVAMLANEAADAVNHGICDVRSVDLAMQKGVNYPRGPLAWADAIGLARVVAVLRNLDAAYGDNRYRVSPLLQHQVYAGERFHDGG